MTFVRSRQPGLPLLLFALALLLPAMGLARGWPAGEPMTITGQVTDAAGTPVAGVTVLLELSRERFRLSRWARERQGLLQLPTVTNVEGRFDLSWSWDPYYNGFELVVALPVRQEGQERFKVFLRRPLEDEIKASGPRLSTTLVLQDTTYLQWLQNFLRGLASPVQARVYEELGLPDQVDRDAETNGNSWWYFALGKVYRFEAGELIQTQEFDPIVSP